MIISVTELRQFIDTDLTDSTLEAKLQALEVFVRKYTNNNFQNRNFRTTANIVGGSLVFNYPYIHEGDTIQISNSKLNADVYIYGDMPMLNDENDVLVTKIEYPLDVKMGVIEMIKWKLKNEDEARKVVQSESISRHSVTYLTDNTEYDIDVAAGVPKKYTAFLNLYMKARF